MFELNFAIYVELHVLSSFRLDKLPYNCIPSNTWYAHNHQMFFNYFFEF